jgi:NADPH2:quinone reductase
VLELLGTGKVIPALYDPIYDGLDEVAKGLDDLDKRKTWGRAVVRVRKDDSKTQARL